jgi:glycosyltransferase involved in cell wall biosynthesis
MAFSVLMSVYVKEKPDHLDTALNSVIDQTLVPDEIVLVKDGPLTLQLDAVVEKYRRGFKNFVVLQLDQNVGLGKALALGVEACSHELIARMDSDDIAFNDRFEKQVSFMERKPALAACGGHIAEFKEVPGDLKKIKEVPLSHSEIKSYARLRNPLNHPSVMLRKQAVLQVGSYKDISLFEDYYLWLRLLQQGYALENLNETLLHFRIGNMISRRQGLPYFRKELTFFKRLKAENLISTYDFFLLIATRLPFRILPRKILAVVYNTFLREGGFLSKQLRTL